MTKPVCASVVEECTKSLLNSFSVEDMQKPEAQADLQKCFMQELADNSDCANCVGAQGAQENDDAGNCMASDCASEILTCANEIGINMDDVDAAVNNQKFLDCLMTQAESNQKCETCIEKIENGVVGLAPQIASFVIVAFMVVFA